MKVAVIGSGSVGLIYLKNLKEDGLDVTGFDRCAKPGGIWVLNNDEKVTCALPSTRVNFSKHRVCTSDFPHLDSVPLHPSRQDMEDYHLRYAHHFDLLRHIKFNTEVVSVDLVDPDADEPRYVVTYRLDGHEERDEFDKIVVATGLNTRPNVPKIQGMEQWEGEVWNSQSFKSGATLRGKNVVVVGSRSSASDVLEELVRNGAGKVYMSHRRGVLNVPRGFAGKTLDFYFGRRAQYILDTLDSIGSYWARGPMNLLMGTFSKWSFNLKDEWDFKPFPDIYSGVLTISDVIVPLLEAGRITSVPSISSIDSPNSLTLANGITLHDIDAIVFATGYLGSLPTVLSPAVTARMAPPPFVNLKLDADSNGSDSDGFLHLYRGVIAASLPSVAIHVRGLAAEGVTASTDLMGMWLAGVWTGQIPLASEEDRWKGCLEDKAWHLGLRKYFTSITPGHIRATVNFYWFAQQVGCEIDKHLPWTSWSAWKWWLSSSDNRRLSTLLLDGMASPATYRLWGKKRWDGAREMIEKANASSGWTKPTLEEIRGLLAGEGGRFGDNGYGIGDKLSANGDQA